MPVAHVEKDVETVTAEVVGSRNMDLQPEPTIVSLLKTCPPGSLGRWAQTLICCNSFSKLLAQIFRGTSFVHVKFK